MKRNTGTVSKLNNNVKIFSTFVNLLLIRDIHITSGRIRNVFVGIKNKKSLFFYFQTKPLELKVKPKESWNGSFIKAMDWKEEECRGVGYQDWNRLGIKVQVEIRWSRENSKMAKKGEEVSTGTQRGHLREALPHILFIRISHCYGKMEQVSEDLSTLTSKTWS